MNNKDQFEEDLLKKYLGPDKIEKAPEGFMVKTMTRISLNTESEKVSEKNQIKNYVPLISALVTIILIVAALFIPAGQTGTIGSYVLNLIRDFQITLAQIEIIKLPELNLPGYLLYVFISILALAFFDKALTGIFHKED